MPLLVLMAISVAIYHRVVQFDLIEAWDDTLYLLSRPEVQDWFGADWTARLLTPELGYPVPLPTAFYALIRELPADMIVPAAHGLNLCFHLSAVGFAYLLTRRWLERWPAFTAVALWTAHPLLVESVAWITNLKVVTLATFSFLGLYFWKRSVEELSLRSQVAAILCFIAALACRPEAVVLPALYACLTVWDSSARALIDRERAWPIWVAAAIAAIYVPFAVLGQSDVLAATRPDMSTTDYLSRIGAAFLIQLEHVFQPFELHPGYYPGYPGMSTDAALGAVLALALLGLTAWSWRRKYPARVGLTLFWAFYLPASGISVLPRFTADTYMYVPLLGLLFAIVAAYQQLELKASIRKAAAALAVVVMLGLSLLSYSQTLRWRNGVTLWEPTITAYPTQAQPYWIVARTHQSRGNHQEALEVYRAGEHAFYERRRIPLGYAEQLLRAGEPARAAQVAADVITESELRDPSAPLFFAWVVGTHTPELSKDEVQQAVYKAAAEELSEKPPDWDREVFLRFASALDQRGMTTLARRVRAASPSL